ncbi:uncharacterized protein TM35_000074560 [Trypanosoma theileri]|uniref:Uncharacterized protein n=1 Tax=Trypanosoma theileri TaxID=67003 RepID=A0A1X0P297_9TRYP|nr:uncharacterized protein TM35_000074560 [Trypanosoma theileri]ORC91032.1 hypothetical protein TM35_000074560 [Trypanosoma theileri]
MSYAKPTFSSKRRARTPPHDSTDKLRSVNNMSDTAHLNNNNKNNNSRPDAKRSRKEGRTVHHPHEEELRLSQEFTSQCDAAVQRVNALLDRAQQREEHIQRTLQASLDRSPPRPASRSPQSNTRLSGLFGTPQVPQAPPPTPAHPGESSHNRNKSNNNNNQNNNNNDNNNNNSATETASTTGWISRMLWGASETPASPLATGTTPLSKQMKSPQSAESTRGQQHTQQTQSCSPPPASPAEQNASLLQRAVQRLSGRFSSPPPPPPKTESPRRSRKSVAFKEPEDLVTLTPPRPTAKTSSDENQKEDVEPAPRGSLVYPPAPPPSAKKESRSRSRSPSSEDEKEHKGPDLETPDVGAIIREFSQARALRELTKADLLAYAKQHHINVSMSSTKKEMFEVARRLAKDNVEKAN